MIGRELEYDFPQGVFLLIGVFILLGFLLKVFFFQKKTFENLGNSQILSKSITPRSSFINHLKTAALILAWAFATVALMQPKGGAHYQGPVQKTTKTTPQDIILLLDASASMEAKDTRLGTTRLDYAKEVSKEIVNELQGPTVAVYAFTSELTPLVPPTQDKLFAYMMLDQLHINQGEASGTDLFSALQALYNGFQPEEKELKTVILLSDGGDNRFESASQAEQTQFIQALKLQKYPYAQLITLGMGSKEGKLLPEYKITTKLDGQLLSTLAQEGKGWYFSTNALSTAEIAKKVVDSVSNQQSLAPSLSVPTTAQKLLSYDYYFQWPLGLAIFLLLIVLFLPDTFYRVLPVLLCATPLFGFESTQERDAYDEYESGQYPLAVAFYQQQLDESKKPLRTAIIHYNLGTIYLAEGKLSQALEEFSLIKDRGQLPQQLLKKLAINTILTQLHYGIKESEPIAFLEAQRTLRNLKKTLCGTSPNCILPDDVTEIEQYLSTLKIPTAPTPKSPPEAIIRSILMELEQFTAFIEMERNDPAKVKDLIQKINSFLPAVIDYQYKVYHSEKDLHCQKDLWEKALPYFYEGSEAMSDALQSLDKKDFSTALEQDEKALRLWILVLNNLKNPPPPPPPHEEARQNSLHQVLQYLQEMERDDISPTIPRPVVKQGLKPW